MKNLPFNLKSIILFFGIAMTMQSCVSNRAFQTARTTEKEKIGGGLGMSFQGGDFLYYDEDGSANLEPVGGFTMEAFARYGITDNMDFGINLSPFGTSGVDLKFQMVGDQESKIAASIGGGIGMVAFDVSDDGNSGVIDFFIPGYLSIHPVDMIGVYVSPRYTLRTISGNRSSYFGGLLGFRVGPKEGAFFIEFGKLINTSNTNASATQLNMGFAYGIN